MGLIDPERAVQQTDLIWTKLLKLRNAVAQKRSRVTCLRRWSEFIRERDGHRCVDCHSRKGLSAHHISRKCMFTGAEFDTGNGLTLCRDCHKEVHQGFNGRPDLSLPVDAQGGEKLRLMKRLYSILVDDAVDRGLMNDELYFLSDEILQTFGRMQGYDQPASFPGTRRAGTECSSSHRRSEWVHPSGWTAAARWHGSDVRDRYDGAIGLRHPPISGPHWPWRSLGALLLSGCSSNLFRS